MSYRPSDFRELLMTKYEAKRQQSPGYSLRKFATFLGLTPSNLSDILKGRCGLSTPVAARIGELLEMSDFEKRLFSDLVEAQHARSRSDREAALKRLEDYDRNPFKPEAATDADVISKWYDSALIELLTMTGGEFEETQFAQRLKISIEDVRDAVERLLARGVIEKRGQTLNRVDSYVYVQSQTPSKTIRDYHRQIFKLSEEALEQPIAERKFLSTMMTFDSRRIAEARAFLEEVDREFFARFEAKSDADSVFCAGFQLFRVDQPRRDLQS